MVALGRQPDLWDGFAQACANKSSSATLSPWASRNTPWCSATRSLAVSSQGFRAPQLPGDHA